MRLKKNKDVKKYISGGALASLGATALQVGLGINQISQAKKSAARIKETPTAKPSEYAQMLKEARNAELEQRRIEELNRKIATSVSAAQQGGGRAMVGSLPGIVTAGDLGTIDILGKRQADTMQALQFGAQGSEAELARKTQREMMQRQAAQAALEGGIQNVAGGVGQLGKAAAYGLFGAAKKDGTTTEVDEVTTEETMSPELMTKAQDLARFAFESGGMITDGKFDHKTNPIDIVKGGKKVGEMTGGEVILNPAQQKRLSKESAYFRQLLKKFNKQK